MTGASNHARKTTVVKAMDRDVVTETERDRVIEAVTTLFVETDKRDWAAVQSCFAPGVFFDMSSQGGGPPGVTTPDRIVQGWKNGLKNLEAIHHQVGNFLVHINGEAATVFCYGIAFHYLPNPSRQNTRTFVGSYEFHLVKQGGVWLIDTMAYHARFVDGNQNPGK
jgi:hypothetical protein